MEYGKVILSEERIQSAIFLAKFKTIKSRKDGKKVRIRRFALSVNGIPFLFKTDSSFNREYINTLSQGEIVFVSYWETNNVSKEGDVINLLHRIGKTMNDLKQSRNPARMDI